MSAEPNLAFLKDLTALPEHWYKDFTQQLGTTVIAVKPESIEIIGVRVKNPKCWFLFITLTLNIKKEDSPDFTGLDLNSRVKPCSEP